ncbi:hypothetical protein AAFF_G00007400 [Aldrovandia affinis]|uniref:Uncharacterized protein n=1 Tax=Aldrovandia affinis TaxID=143900 RepID=A0AAD7T711_9TELE|nr:hypothetical protein AAFF_G00007400 [Aldrovandia affinis]
MALSAFWSRAIKLLSLISAGKPDRVFVDHLKHAHQDLGRPVGLTQTPRLGHPPTVKPPDHWLRVWGPQLTQDPRNWGADSKRDPCTQSKAAGGKACPRKKPDTRTWTACTAVHGGTASTVEGRSSLLSRPWRCPQLNLSSSSPPPPNHMARVRTDEPRETGAERRSRREKR